MKSKQFKALFSTFFYIFYLTIDKMEDNKPITAEEKLEHIYAKRREYQREYLRKIREDDSKHDEYNKKSNLKYWKKKKEELSKDDWRLAITSLYQRRKEFAEYVIEQLGF